MKNQEDKDELNTKTISKINTTAKMKTIVGFAFYKNIVNFLCNYAILEYFLTITIPLCHATLTILIIVVITD